MFEVQRKAFRRSISIILKPRHNAIVRVSKLTSMQTIIDFIESRHGWIDKHLALFKEQERNLPSRALRIGHVYPYFGRLLPLRATVTPLKAPFVTDGGDHLLVHVPLGLRNASDLSFAHEALRDFYRREGGKVLKAKTHEWAEKTGLKPTSVKVREAKTRWGSCHPRGSISLNWRLAVYRPEVMDYVIVHELSHLKHPNHSKAFWSCVASILPGSKELAAELKDQHRLSDFLQPKPVFGQL